MFCLCIKTTALIQISPVSACSLVCMREFYEILSHVCIPWCTTTTIKTLKHSITIKIAPLLSFTPPLTHTSLLNPLLFLTPENYQLVLSLQSSFLTLRIPHEFLRILHNILKHATCEISFTPHNTLEIHVNCCMYQYSVCLFF